MKKTVLENWTSGISKFSIVPKSITVPSESIFTSKLFIDDLLLIEDENGKLRSVKYKDLISSAALEAGLVGPTGPQGEKGHPGVDIVEEFDEPDPEAVIWVQEGEYPEEDLANNIDGYLHDFIRFGEESPYENPEVTDRTMIYLQIDERLEQSNIRVIKVPNDESNFQKQLDLLRNRLDALEDNYVEVYDEDSVRQGALGEIVGCNLMKLLLEE